MTREKTMPVFVALVTVFVTVAEVKNAFAYVDPNTGGYIFQLLFPLISAIAFAYLFLKRQIKMLLVRMGNFFKGIFSKKSSSPDASQENIRKGLD